PGGFQIKSVAIGEMLPVAAVGVHHIDDSDIVLPVSDFLSIRRPCRIYSKRWRTETRLITSIRIHQINLAVTIIAERIKSDSSSIRRPRRIEVEVLVVRDLLDVASVGVHGEDFGHFAGVPIKSDLSVGLCGRCLQLSGIVCGRPVPLASLGKLSLGNRLHPSAFALALRTESASSVLLGHGVHWTDSKRRQDIA